MSTGRTPRKLDCTTHPTVCDEDLGEGPLVASSLAAHGLDGVHRSARCTGGDREDGGKPRRMESVGGGGIGRHCVDCRMQGMRGWM